MNNSEIEAHRHELSVNISGVTHKAVIGDSLRIEQEARVVLNTQDKINIIYFSFASQLSSKRTKNKGDFEKNKCCINVQERLKYTHKIKKSLKIIIV